MISVFFFFKQKTAYEMRISDWSSDVCSSDLTRGKWAGIDPRVLRGHGQCDENREPIEGRRFDQAFPRRGVQPADPDQPCRHLPLRRQIGRGDADARSGQDRKRVGKGKSVSVRVDLGGRRIIKKKQTIKK